MPALDNKGLPGRGSLLAVQRKRYKNDGSWADRPWAATASGWPSVSLHAHLVISRDSFQQEQLGDETNSSSPSKAPFPQ